MTLAQWLKGTRYLPRSLRDFHAQKSLFKAIAPTLEAYKYDAPEYHEAIKATSWSDLHMLTIDVFLWYMARHGYTLQRVPKAQRERIVFLDLEAAIAAAHERERSALGSLLTPLPSIDDGAPEASVRDA